MPACSSPCPEPFARRRPIAAFAFALGAATAAAQVVPPPAQQTEPLTSRRTTQTMRPWVVEPVLSLEETYTTNVDLQPTADKRSDFVTQIKPELRISGRSSRLAIDGAIAAPIFVYARTGDKNNRIAPLAAIAGTLEAVERFFFVDASVNIQDEYFTPFGPRSISPINQPGNSYRTQSYEVAPYIRGEGASDLSYELRDRNIWTNSIGAPITVKASYVNQLLGNVTRLPVPLGWSLDIQRTEVNFKDGNTQRTQVARARGLYRPDPAVEYSVTAGYEKDRIALVDINDSIYGAGVRWRPNERTSLDALWEHRFFGSSYKFQFSSRQPLTLFQFSASRDLTSYPQILAQLPSGSFVPLVLDQLFASRIPDPVQRFQYVVQFINERGLPLVLSNPLSLYSEEMYLQQIFSGTVGLLGVRNAVLLNARHVRTEPVPVPGAILPPAITLQNNNTIDGATLTWTYKVSTLTNVATSVDYQRTKALPPIEGRTSQNSVQSTFTTQLTPITSLHAGARWQVFRSNFGVNDYIPEFATFIGVSHIFR